MRRVVPRFLRWWLAVAACCALLPGCGTTKWSDSPRTATEQLLISDAVDRSISEIDFSVLAHKNVYLDTRFIVTTLDQNYLVSTLRQHMLASGCIIKDKAEDATFVVEVRTGSLGTNRQDLLFGIPATNLPTAGMLPIGSASIPEIALMKRTNQQGVCKVAVFAYDRMSGRPVWQSGNRKVASRAKDIWVMGAGPFQGGTIHEGTSFAGEKLKVPLVKGKAIPESHMTVAEERVFTPQSQAIGPDQPGKVENAGFLTPVPDQKPPTAAPAAAPAPIPAPAPAAPASPPAATGTAAPAATPAAAPATPPKAAYTPPPPAPTVVPPPVPTPGPQGNLVTQPLFSPTANAAATTAGAIQTFNWAKELLDKPKTEAD